MTVRGALELADLRQHLVAQADIEIRRGLLDQRAATLLAAGVGIAVEEHHRERLHPCAGQRRHGPADLLLVKRDQDVAVGIRPLLHFRAQIACHQRLEPALHAVGGGTRPAAKLEQVAEAVRGEQAGPRALALKQRIGADGRAMRDEPQRGDIGKLPQPSDKPLGLIARGRNLADDDRTGRLVHDTDVGECPSDIHPGHQSHSEISNPIFNFVIDNIIRAGCNRRPRQS